MLVDSRELDFSSFQTKGEEGAEFPAARAARAARPARAAIKLEFMRQDLNQIALQLWLFGKSIVPPRR